MEKEPLLLEAKYGYLDNINISGKSEKFEDSVSEVTKSVSTSETKLLEEVNTNLVEIINSNSIGIRVSQNNLEKILLSGHIKNQFETGESLNGKYDIEGRKVIESDVLGVSLDTLDIDRPIYGMLFDFDSCKDDNEYSMLIETGPGYFFGDCVIVLNKEVVSPYCTFTVGDSYADSENTKASLLNKPIFLGGRPELILKLFKNNFNVLDSSGWDLNYIEVQIHGHENHELNVIKNIIFSEQPNVTLSELLYQHQIPYTVLNPNIERRSKKYKKEESVYYSEPVEAKDIFTYIKLLVGKITFINFSGISKLYNHKEKNKTLVK